MDIWLSIEAQCATYLEDRANSRWSLSFLSDRPFWGRFGVGQMWEEGP
jgi:hypothetical protein